MTAQERTKFLLDLRRMLNEDGTEFPAPWSQVPDEYQEDFKSWVGEYKQQIWTDMWEKAWANYQLEYLRYKVERIAEQIAYE